MSATVTCKCGHEMTSNGVVKTAPFFIQSQGIEDDPRWYRERYVCLHCGWIVDRRLMTNELMNPLA